MIFFKKIRYRKTSPVQNQRIKREEEKEEEQQQQQIDNRNAWIPHPKIPGGLFDNVINMNGIVYYYTMAPNTYNWSGGIIFKKIVIILIYKYPAFPLPTNYKKNRKPGKEGYLICKKKLWIIQILYNRIGYFNHHKIYREMTIVIIIIILLLIILSITLSFIWYLVVFKPL